LLKLRVISEALIAPNIKLIELESAGDKLPAYGPGAHIKINIPNDILGGETRNYSLINLESDLDTGKSPDIYRLGVLLEEQSTGGSSYIHALKVGDQITCQSPSNDFPLGTDDNPLLIAGGIGVTPIASMVSELLRNERRFEFHYAGRSSSSLAFISELQANAGDRLELHFDDQENALDLSRLFEAIDTRRHVYVCGPKGMIEATKQAAEMAGISAEHIHFELFSNDANLASDDSFEVEISSTGAVYIIPAGRTIIDVLEDEGVDVMYDCQRGDCGICQTNVLAGTPDHRDVVLSEDEKASGDVMQICVSRAKSERLVLEI
jgi:ferredoxin-NADP reductase